MWVYAPFFITSQNMKVVISTSIFIGYVFILAVTLPLLLKVTAPTFWNHVQELLSFWTTFNCIGCTACIYMFYIFKSFLLLVILILIPFHFILGVGVGRRRPRSIRRFDPAILSDTTAIFQFPPQFIVESNVFMKNRTIFPVCRIAVQRYIISQDPLQFVDACRNNVN